MGKRYLLDTNIVIDFLGNKLPTKAKKHLSGIVDSEINLSVINKIELLGFSTVDQEIIDFVSFSTIFPMDDSIVDKTIRIRSLYHIKLPDAIIAATALFHQCTLITRNTKDFRKIDGLRIENPYDL